MSGVEVEPVAEQRRHRSTFVTVDPGLRHTGISVWRDGRLEYTVLNTLPSRVQWCAASAQQAMLLSQLQEVEFDIQALWIEFPVHMASVVGGAAAIRGDTLKLAYLVGQLTQAWTCGCARLGAGAFIVPIPVNTWKGQLPKAVVNAQVLHILGRERCATLKADEWDAVGIGLWVTGRFPIRNKSVDKDKESFGCDSGRN